MISSQGLFKFYCKMSQLKDLSQINGVHVIVIGFPVGFEIIPFGNYFVGSNKFT